MLFKTIQNEVACIEYDIKKKDMSSVLTESRKLSLKIRDLYDYRTEYGLNDVDANAIAITRVLISPQILNGGISALNDEISNEIIRQAVQRNCKEKNISTSKEEIEQLLLSIGKMNDN